MPTGNLPDPDLTAKLDAAFGPDQPNVADDYKAFASGWRAAGGDDAYAAEQDAVGALAEAYERGYQAAIQPTAPTLIYAKMIEVARKVSAVGKASVNQQQGYNFRGIDAVVDALHPVMSEVGVFAVPELISANYRDAMTTNGKPTREVTVQVRYTFYAEDGSYVQAVVPGESLDQADKGSPKAMSVAFRIALLQVFSLPTSEPDPDASYHTRDGVGAMPDSVRALLLGAVPTASIPELAPLWAVVLEHSAAERAISNATITWADYFALRVVEIIDQIETVEVGRERYEELKVSPVRHLRYHSELVTTMMTNRAAFIKQRAANVFDQHVTAVGNAQTLEELDAAHEAMNADYDGHVITTQQKIELLDVIGDKRAKLERELNVPAPVDPSGSES